MECVRPYTVFKMSRPAGKNRDRRFTIREGVVVEKKPRPNPGGSFFSSGDDDNDEDAGFFASTEETDDVPMSRESGEYERYVAALTHATGEGNTDTMKSLVLQRFGELCSEPVLRDAMAHRLTTMEFVSDALTRVLKLYLLPTYTGLLRPYWINSSEATRPAVSEDECIAMCDPIIALYNSPEPTGRRFSMFSETLSLCEDLLDVRAENMPNPVHVDFTPGPELEKFNSVRAAGSLLVAAKKSESYDYLSRLGTTPWRAPDQEKLASVCAASCGVGLNGDTPADLRSARAIAEAWFGNLGVEFTFPYGRPDRCDDYNLIMFGNTMLQRPRWYGVKGSACVICIALRLYVRLMDRYFGCIETVDDTNLLGERGVALMVANYATFPRALMPDGGLAYATYQANRVFMIQLINAIDAACRIGIPNKPVP